MIINPVKAFKWLKYADKKNIQQSGIDVTVKEVKKIVRATEKIEYKSLDLPCILEGQCAYDILFNEYVEVPSNAVATLMTRSTFNRKGAFVTVGLYDNNFRNFIGCVLHTTVPIAVGPNERIAQIVFSQTRHDAFYKGQYQDRSK